MRICLYTSTALPKLGGQEVVVDELARQFLALGHDPVVLAPWHRSHGPFDAATVPYEVAWHPRFLSTRWFVSWYGRWMANLHRAGRFDLIHCHGTYPAGYVAATCQALDEVPLVITSHGDDLAPLGLYERKPELRERYRTALARADAAIAISDYTSQLYRRAYPELQHVANIPNGVNVRRYAAPAPRPADLDRAIQPGQYLLFLGRLDARKGVDVLLHALAAADRLGDRRDDRCRLDLVVAGKGPESAALTSLAKRLGLAFRVHFVGQAEGDRKTWLLQNGFCTILSSRIWEAFPIVLIESYASGRPVIATDVPGLRERVQHGRTGLLVTPENPQRMAEAIVHMTSSRNQADVWGSEARRFARQFDWSDVAVQHLELFSEVVSRRQQENAAHILRLPRPELFGDAPARRRAKAA